MKRLNKEQKAWMQGYACAVANLINKSDMVDTQVGEAYSDGGFSNLSENDMAKIGIDPHDIETFKKHDLIRHF